MKRRQYAGFAAFCGMLILIIDSKTALEGAQVGIDLCIRTVIPSLFPFIILSMLLTGSLMDCGFPLLGPLGRAFSMPKGTEAILLPAFLGGYPVGAQAVSQASRSGCIDKQTASKMLAFCSNAGPAFLFGMCSRLFANPWLPWVLWVIHIAGALLAARLISPELGALSARMEKTQKNPDILSASLRTMAQICGWVILFRVLIGFLEKWCLWLVPEEVQASVIGLLELSNGISALAGIGSEQLRFVLCACFLAFGGICVTMQTVSVTPGLSLRYYMAGKLLQTLFSLLISIAVVYRSWFILAGMVPVFIFLVRKREKRCSIPGKAVV